MKEYKQMFEPIALEKFFNTKFNYKSAEDLSLKK